MKKRKNISQAKFMIIIGTVLFLTLTSALFYSNFKKSVEFKWDKTNLTYSFIDSEKCGIYEIARVKKAFNEVEKSIDNIITFSVIEDNGDIAIECTEEKSVTLECLSEGAAGISILDTQGNKIVKAAVRLHGINPNFISNFNCYPSTEVHEILHGLGFGHIDNPDSIMYPYLHYYEGECLEDRKIDEGIISKIREIYG